MSNLKRRRILSIIMTAAILFTSLPALAFSVSASENDGGLFYEYSEGFNSPGSKAEKSRSRGEFAEIPAPPVKISPRAEVKGEQNGTNYSFVVPVSHKKTAPEGWIAISNVSDFDLIRNNLSGNFILMGDEDGRFDMGDVGFSPIGSLSLPFTGVFDGNGYVIEGLNITTLPDYDSYVAGLFGAINGATIKNLGIANLTINIPYDGIQSMGSIAGMAIGSVIENCFNNGNVVNIYEDYAVTDAGGIVGSTWNTIVRNSFNTGYVGTDDYGKGDAQTAGGIAAGSYFAGTEDENNQSTQLYSVIENCYNEGYISAYDDAGGIIGEIFGHVSKSYNSGYVYGGSYAGGLVGSGTTGHYINKLNEDGSGEVADNTNADNLKPGNKLVNSYNTGEVKTADVTEIFAGTGSAGGLVGLMVTLSIESCYNSNSQNTDSDYYGGLVATNKDNTVGHPSVGEIINSYYPDSFSNYIQNIDEGEFLEFVTVGYTASASLPVMQTQSFYEGFDFGGVWTIEEGENTPELMIFANDYVKLSGTVYYPGNDEEYVLSTNKQVYTDGADITVRFWSDKVGALYDFSTQSDENGYYEIWILPLTDSPTTVIASASGFSTYAFNEYYGIDMFAPGTDDGRAQNEDEQRWIFDYDIYLHRGVMPPPNLVLKGFTSYTETKINQVTGAVEYMTPLSLGGVRIDVESYYYPEDPVTHEKSDKLQPYVYTTYSSYATGTKNSAFNARFFPGDIKITASKDGFINTYVYRTSDKKIDGLDITLTAMFDNILIPMEINRIAPSEDGVSGAATPVENTSGFGFSLTDVTQDNRSLAYRDDFTVTSRLKIDYNIPFYDADTGEVVGYKSEPDGFYLSVSGKSVKTEIQRDKFIGGTIDEGDKLKLEVMDTTGKIKDNVKENSFTLQRIKDRDNPPDVDTLIFDFDSQGYWIAENFDASYQKGMALIFNADDNFVDRAIFNPETNSFKSAELFEGSYTVVFIESYPSMSNPANISYLDDNQYSYTRETVNIYDGHIIRINLSGTLPVIDKNFEYLDWARTSIKLDKYRGFPNMQVVTTIDFAINKSLLRFVDKNQRVSVTVNLTENFSVYNNSVRLDGKKLARDTEYEVLDDGRTLNIFVPADSTAEGAEADISGSIKIGLLARTEGMHGVSATVNFTRDDEGFGRAVTEISRLIGSAEFTAYEIDITNLPENPPASTTADEFRVTGTATPYTWIKVMVNGVEQQPSVKSDSKGNWKKSIDFDYDLVTSEYKIIATNGKGTTGEHTLIHLVEDVETILPTISKIDVSSGEYWGSWGDWEYKWVEDSRYTNGGYWNTDCTVWKPYGVYAIVYNSNYGYWETDYTQFVTGYYNEYYYNYDTSSYGYRLQPIGDYFSGWVYNSVTGNEYGTFPYGTRRGNISFDYTNSSDRGRKALYFAERVPYKFNVNLNNTAANTLADKVWVYVKDGNGRDLAIVELDGSGDSWTQQENFGAADYSILNNYYNIDSIYVRYGNESRNEYIDGEYCYISPYYDPAGYVYEAVESNRVEGVTATLYEAEFSRDLDGNIIEYSGNEGGEVDESTRKLWVDPDTENPQENNQLTDSEGEYAYQVGVGAYQVEFSKEGYEPRLNNPDTLHERSDNWLIVPPAQTEVNVGIRSTASPEVVGARAVEDVHGQKYVSIDFSQYMNAATLRKEAGNVTMKVNGETTDNFGITFAGGEFAAADDEISTDRFYAKTMEIWIPDETTGLPGTFEDRAVVEITISGSVTNYRDGEYNLGGDWIGTVTMPPYGQLEVDAPTFKIADVGYAQPEAQAITIENTGDSSVNISSVTVSPEDAFTISDSGETVELGVGATTGNWKIQPNAYLARGVYEAVITVAYDGVNSPATAKVLFEVEGIEIGTNDEGNNYVSGVRAGSSGMDQSALAELLADKGLNVMEIVNQDGTPVTDDIGTGMILRAADENGVVTDYTISVKYDVTGAGRAGLSDIFIVLDHEVGNITFNTAQELAIGDVRTGLRLIFDMIDYAVGNR